MIHNFDLSLQHERQQAGLADAFYREVLHVSEIIRYNSDTEHDMDMQRQDVDVTIVRKGISYKVSEKFRSKDYGDLYVEVFSKYPHVKGWLETGTPNAILYFTPESVYWITHKSLSTFCLHTLFPLVPPAWYAEIFNSGKPRISKTLRFDNRMIALTLIQAHNRLDGCCWETIGLCAPFSFFEENGVRIRKYPLEKSGRGGAAFF
ncbi:MAG TPA: hypothetical protein VK152_03930 [Paludibacter sp.]|nr:hypothetical protein [Paludibacter sp.]